MAAFIRKRPEDFARFFRSPSFYALQSVSESQKHKSRCELYGMSDNSVARQGGRGLRGYFTLRQALVNTAIFVYCLLLFLGFDFAYSPRTRGEETARSPRVANPVYDHGFAADFDGYDLWGELRYRLITDS